MKTASMSLRSRILRQSVVVAGLLLADVVAALSSRSGLLSQIIAIRALDWLRMLPSRKEPRLPTPMMAVETCEFGLVWASRLEPVAKKRRRFMIVIL